MARTVQTIDLTLYASKRWFFWLALLTIAALGKLGLIRDKPSAEYVDGIVTGQERAAKWLADNAMRIEAR